MRTSHRLVAAALSAFVAFCAVGLAWCIHGAFDLALVGGIGAAIGGVLGYAFGPRIGYLFLFSVG